VGPLRRGWDADREREVGAGLMSVRLLGRSFQEVINFITILCELAFAWMFLSYSLGLGFYVSKSSVSVGVRVPMCTDYRIRDL
jgi:hypothetical protein